MATHVPSGFNGARSMFVAAVTKVSIVVTDCPYRKRTWPEKNATRQPVDENRDPRIYGDRANK